VLAHLQPLRPPRGRSTSSGAGPMASVGAHRAPPTHGTPARGRMPPQGRAVGECKKILDYDQIRHVPFLQL